ncbi:MAG: F0F1 ATP synthase subunit B [Lachnospiraceae bacterium]
MVRLFNLDLQLISDATIQLVISVFVLFTLLSYNLFNPVRKVLQDRQDRIKGEIESAKSDKAKAAELKETYDAKLKNVEKEAEDILSDARQKALKNETKIIDEAKEEAAAIIKRAREEAELEKKRAMDDMKQEMIAIASAMAAKVVSANIDTTIQDSLVEETLREMGESTWQS